MVEKDKEKGPPKKEAGIGKDMITKLQGQASPEFAEILRLNQKLKRVNHLQGNNGREMKGTKGEFDKLKDELKTAQIEQNRSLTRARTVAPKEGKPKT